MAAERLDFVLPPALEAHEPPEARGIPRDGVRLMVSERSSGRLTHALFRELPRFLEAGTVLVFNRSGTLPAAVEGVATDGRTVKVHFSTPLPGGTDNEWTVEIRDADGGRSFASLATTGTVRLRGDASATLVRGYPDPNVTAGSRLWVARLELGMEVQEYLARFGRPIRYGHIRGEWPTEAYQTVYGDRPGSAEMPSAGRPFTSSLLDELRANGVEVRFLTLHTGVSSQEADETPFAEWFEVPWETADAVRRAKAEGRPVIAVGTTVVRALESAAGRAANGWTELVVTPERGVRYVDGLITGWHEPRASHLLMLEAIAGRRLLEASYAEAIRAGYLWHEFGDSQLILP
jgi:S-adenosylmethionine:tRNA ribosyltransferase-isomerase